MDNICGFCGKGGHLQVCGACKQEWYCCKQHQKAHWRTHKPTCRVNAKQTCGRETSRGGHTASATPPSSARSEPEVALTNHSPHVHGLQEGPGFEASTLAVSSVEAEPEDSSCIECGHDLDNMTISNHQCTVSSPLGPTSGMHNTNFPPPEFYMEDNSNGATSDISHRKINSRSDNRKSARAACSPVAGDRQRRSSTGSGRNIADYIVKCMNDYGICVVDNFLGDDKSLMLVDEVKQLHEAGELSDGQLVDSDHPGEITQKVRGDKITWVEVGDKGAYNIGLLVQRIDKLILKCNGKLGRYNINGRTKAMVACYPGNGAYYMRHVDNPNADGRCITCIYYLNPDWDVAKHGGLLRIFPSKFSHVADIVPQLDRLLFFWSDRRNPHEVHPAHRTRYAITVWFFDEEERLQARERHNTKDGKENSHTLSHSLKNNSSCPAFLDMTKTPKADQ